MSDAVYRYEEIGIGKKVFWIITTALILIVSISLIMHGRGIYAAKANRLTEQRNAEEKVKAEQKAREEENRKLEAKRVSDARTLKELASLYYTIPGLKYYDRGEYITGKVLVLDRKARSIDSINSSLPSELRATTVNDVGTIVWLDWDQELRGSYTNSRTGVTMGDGYRYTCELSIIDKSIPARVGSKTFLGSEPPKGVFSSAARDHYGSKPNAEIITYLKNLPRR